jgi:hypothetical protein
MTETRYTVTEDAPELLRAIEANGHASAGRDPDHEKWARYWQEMREECIRHVGSAFDHVAKSFEAGETEGTVALVLFCADEARGCHGILGALQDLLARYFKDYQVSSEAQAGVSIDDLVTMIGVD